MTESMIYGSALSLLVLVGFYAFRWVIAYIKRVRVVLDVTLSALKNMPEGWGNDFIRRFDDELNRRKHENDVARL